MRVPFTLDGYRQLLSEFAQLGYEVRRFDDYDRDRAHLILRHDVDFSLNDAVRLGELESDHNAEAYYYVLLRSKFYNVFNPEELRGIKRLVALGHNIGLHFDASLYVGCDRDDLEAHAVTECSLLEDLLGTKVDSISFHRPAPELVGLKGLFASRIHTYHPDFVELTGYCSDSGGAWRYQYPLDHEAVRGRRALQLLTHPIWWVRSFEDEPADRIERFLSDLQKGFEREAAANCKPYQERLDGLPQAAR